HRLGETDAARPAAWRSAAGRISAGRRHRRVESERGSRNRVGQRRSALELAVAAYRQPETFDRRPHHRHRQDTARSSALEGLLPLPPTPSPPPSALPKNPPPDPAPPQATKLRR